MNLSKNDITKFKRAFYKDYKVKLTDEQARSAAGNILQLYSSLLKFRIEDNNKKVLKSS